MSTKTIEYKFHEDPDSLAGQVAMSWDNWKGARSIKEAEWKELRNYIFATDTRHTSNNTNGMKNSTTRPKLTQIRDNLHANYMAALFPNEDWFEWKGGDRESVTAQKAQLIEAYAKTKIEQSDFISVVSQLVLDWIDYGNCFAEVVYEEDILPGTDEDPSVTVKYVGPRLNRISPLDIVMNLHGKSFHKTPHIVRAVLSLGELKKLEAEQPTSGWIAGAISECFQARSNLQSATKADIDVAKKHGNRVDGFGDMYDYYMSGMVELLELVGDIYDPSSDTLYENHRIIIADREKVLFMAPMDSWLGRSNREHAGWRQRPDNLWGMGPLDNLIGLQYRIDHLENLKADVFDQIAWPMAIHYGNVEDWEYGYNERIYADVDARVEFPRPDSQALNADFEIARLEQQMEEMAGAPRQAVGIRTPGEKTKFEVQTLENNAGRAFQHKINWFEATFLEPLLNQYIAAARQNLSTIDQIRVVDKDFGAIEFLDISKDDLQATGKLVPKGARHFARQTQLFQNLMGFANSNLYNDPAIAVHYSGLEIAKITQELLELDAYTGLVTENVRVAESVETQRATQAGQQMVAQDAQQMGGGLPPEGEPPIG